MSTQVSVQLPDTIFEAAKDYAQEHGYVSVQEFIRELLRERLFDGEEVSQGRHTALASEASLAKHWLTKEEDEAWAHLQEAT